MAYADRIIGARFVEFLRRRLIFIRELLADNGSLYLHLDWRKTHYLKVVCDEVFGEQNFRSQIVWQRTNARSTRERWPRIHDVILFYTKTSDYMFRSVDIAADKRKMPHTLIGGSDGKKYQTYELTAQGETKKGESGMPWRSVKLPPGRHWANTHATMDGWEEEGLIHWPKNRGFPRKRAEEPFDEDARTVVVGDIWNDIDRINQAAKERLKYPTQKPEALLDRIISASSNEGDLVLDAFVGSGTTAVVADGLGRRWIGIDCGKFAVYTTQSRLLAKSLHAVEAQPFELATGGLYHNDLLEELSFPDFQSFCLDLFGCRPGKHTISDVPMAGTRKGAPVHFFRYDQTEAVMGRDYIESLHERIGSKVSGSVCVIAPVSACDPGLFEDIVQLGKVSYFILRVPYSVIEALHDRGFEHIEQPASEEEINNPLDAYGFDFIELPEVSLRREADGETFRLHIESFMRGGLDPDDFDQLPDAGRGDLAMVMMDATYDGELFRISHWKFADELKSAEWALSLALSECGERLMVIFLDTHGNERREIIAPTADTNAEPTPARKASANSSVPR